MKNKLKTILKILPLRKYRGNVKSKISRELNFVDEQNSLFRGRPPKREIREI